MRPASATIAIDAPREHVFDLLRDLAVRPSFTDHFLVDLRLERVDPVGVGAAARFQLDDTRVWMDTVIEAAERPHLIRERGHGGRLNRVPSFTVWELADGPGPRMCELTLTFWTEPATIFDRIRESRGTARRLRRGWRRALPRLRAVAESDAAPPRIGVGGADRLPSLA